SSSGITTNNSSSSSITTTNSSSGITTTTTSNSSSTTTTNSSSLQQHQQQRYYHQQQQQQQRHHQQQQQQQPHRCSVSLAMCVLCCHKQSSQILLIDFLIEPKPTFITERPVTVYMSVDAYNVLRIANWVNLIICMSFRTQWKY